MAENPNDLFVGVTAIRSGGGVPYVEVTIQPDTDKFPDFRLPDATFKVPVRSMTLTADEKSEIEGVVRRAVDWTVLEALIARYETQVKAASD